MGASCSACMKPSASKESDDTYLQIAYVRPVSVIGVKEELVDNPVELKTLKNTPNEAENFSEKQWLNEQEWIEKIKINDKKVVLGVDPSFPEGEISQKRMEILERV